MNRVCGICRMIGNCHADCHPGVIRLYQANDLALAENTCRFYPSCSHYGYQAVYKYGALKGSLMAGWRVLRCNPFNPGGYDPVQ
jgi:putative membrane protein insertion efficiency factor